MKLIKNAAAQPVFAAADEEGKNMTKKQKKQLYRIFAAAAIYLITMALPLTPTGKLAGFLLCYGVIGWDIIWKAVTNILHVPSSWSGT